MKGMLMLFNFIFSIAALSQNVGIGTTIPQSRLHIVDGISGYSGGYYSGITLEGSSNRYLNLIPPSGSESGVLFRNNSDAASGGIVYNNGGTNSLQLRTNGNLTRMTIDASGNVGIGINPGFKLDVNGRMQIRGSSPNDAGIWLSNAGGARGFLGLENDNYIGLYGANGAGWNFTMNTQSGAIKINATEGSLGQVLKSNGPGQPVSWSDPLSQLYNNMTEYAQTGTTTVNPLSSTNIPGMSGIVLNITTRSKVVFSASLQVTSDPCFACGGSHASLVIQVNFPGGSAQGGGTAESDVGSGEIRSFVTGNMIRTLNPGSYTINSILGNGNVSGPTVTGRFGRLDIIIIPE